jgi:hypothetical protein
MFAFPSKRAIQQVHHFIPRHFHAERQCLRRQPFSSSPSRDAKRSNVPRYRQQAEKRDQRPGGPKHGPSNQRDLGGIEAKTHDVLITTDFAKGLQELGFYSILDVKDVLVKLYVAASEIPPAKAIQNLATQRSMFTRSRGNVMPSSTISSLLLTYTVGL